MKKVLIISYDYPPLNNIASRRFSEIVPYLQELGWDPYILTTHSTGDLPSNLPEKNIIRFSNHPQSLVKHQDTNKSALFHRVRRKLNLRLNSFDSSVSTWCIPIIQSNLIQELKSLNIDLIIATYRPPAALRLGKKIASELNTPWIADFRDLGALYKSISSSIPPVLELIDRIHEHSLIKSASAITTVSNALADHLKLTYHKETVVIYNGWITNNNNINETQTTIKPFHASIPYIYYAGRFYNHRMDSIRILMDSIKDVEILLVIRSLGPIDLEESLIEYARKNNIINKIKILPPAPQNIINIEQNQSAINLVVEDLDKTFEMQKGVLTGKLMQLLTFPSPILAIAREDSEIGDILNETRKGELLSTQLSIEKFIINTLESRSLGSLFDPDIHSFSKQEQAKKLVALMNQLISEDAS